METAPLRARLRALRTDCLRQLAALDGPLDAGLLALVASTSATLAALDEADDAATQPKGDRSVRGGSA